ncbi:MAG: hypothetical protein MHM6MM_008228 [Cercozoa sp. M6MM]
MQGQPLLAQKVEVRVTPNGEESDYEIACVTPDMSGTCTHALHTMHWRSVVQAHTLRLPLTATPAFLSDCSEQWVAFLDAVNVRVIEPRLSLLEPRISAANSAKWFVLLCALLLPSLVWSLFLSRIASLPVGLLLFVALLTILFVSVRNLAAKQNQLLLEVDAALPQCSLDFEQHKKQLLTQHGLPPGLDVRLCFVDWTPASSWQKACALSRFLANPSKQKAPKWLPNGPSSCAGLKLCLDAPDSKWNHGNAHKAALQAVQPIVQGHAKVMVENSSAINPN